MKLKPLNDSIIFEFVDSISQGAFATKTKSGILLSNKNADDNSNTPRWGKVHAIGPDVQDVQVGEYVLVAPLRWTLGFKFEDTMYSKTIEKEVLAVADKVEDVSELFL